MFYSALNEAIKEQERLNRVRPHKKEESPIRSRMPEISVFDKKSERIPTVSSTSDIPESRDNRPWRTGAKGKRPIATRAAIPVNLGPAKPNHPKIGDNRTVSSQYKMQQGSTRTRYQMTQERIMDNVKFFNKAAPA